MDNSKVHHGKRVDRFFDEGENMKPLCLPPYSPDVNPKEYVHRHFRSKLLNNRNFKSVRQIGHVISRFARVMISETVRSIAPLILIEALLSAQKVS